jgi:hypothetical protein
MNQSVLSLIVLSLSGLAVSPAYARNEKIILPIAPALETIGVEDKPTGSVKFFFGTEKPLNIIAKLGSYVANPRSDAMGRSDESACNRALLWTLVALERRARQLGAVINIVSYYDKVATPSTSEFECHVGSVIARVALKGDFVKITDQ